MLTDCKTSFYAVRRGRRRGIYPTWPEAQQHVHGWRGAEHKRLDTREEAEAYMARMTLDEYRRKQDS